MALTTLRVESCPFHELDIGQLFITASYNPGLMREGTPIVMRKVDQQLNSDSGIRRVNYVPISSDIPAFGSLERMLIGGTVDDDMEVIPLR